MVKIADQVRSEKITITVCDSPKTNYHDHEFLELTYVLKGRANHILNGISSVISEGDYFIVDYGVKHQYNQIGEVPFTVVNCLFLPSLIDETLRHCQRFEEVADSYLIKFNYRNLKDAPTKFIYHDSDGHIRNLISRLQKEYTAKDMGYKEIMRCQLIEILIDTMRNVKLPSPIENESDIIKYISDYAAKNYMDKLSLREITKNYPYSLGYISRRFKEERGVSFQEYLQSIRVWEACRLLANTSKKISEISALVGYENIKFFNEIFKRQTGITSREFKKVYNIKNSETI